MLNGFFARQTAMENGCRIGASSSRISSVESWNEGTFTRQSTCPNSANVG